MSLQPVVIHFDIVYHHGEVDDATSKDGVTSKQRILMGI